MTPDADQHGLRADVLARLLLVQSTAGHLPDETAIISFVCRGIEVVPGVVKVWSRKRESEEVRQSSNIQCLPIRFAGTDYGDVLLQVDDLLTFTPYSPHVQNLLFMVGVILEERRQRRLTEEYQRELEKRVEERTCQLSAEKEQLAVTLRSIGDGVITTDTSGRVVVINPVAEQLTGFTQDEARGRLLSEVFVIIDERTQAPCENPVTEVLATEAVVELSNHTQLIARDGTRRAIIDSGAPIRDRTGKIFGVVLVFRDITDKRRLMEQVQRAERLDAIGQLAGGVAHDFNNLLGGIFGYISMARDLAAGNGSQLEALDDALKVFERARDLTRQLLTFSKGGEPVRSKVSLGQLIVDAVRFSLSGSNVAYRLQLPPDLPDVEVDPNQISQVFDNLIRNADQAMPLGGNIIVSAEVIAVRAHERPPLASGQYIKVTVADDGPGIPPDFLPRIFDPFFTTKERGSGLGLATAYSIIKKHDGHIEVESQLGRGSSFRFFLSVSDHSLRSMPSGRVDAEHLGKGRALVMDDEPYLRKLFDKCLTQMGYQVTTVPDGQQAVAAVEQSIAEDQRFAVAVIDLTVPGGMGGKEAIARIRAECPDLVAIASSGYSEDPIMSHPQAYGFSASLPKPFSKAELAAVLESVVGGNCRRG
jgi:two-component system cell cycle sensor histidine kinase/response regulator CckA